MSLCQAGVARRVVVEQCRERGLEVSETRLTKADLLAADLAALGHAVTITAPADMGPEDWLLADLLVWSGGDNSEPLAHPAWRSSLREFVHDGGHLLLEGGEVAFLWSSGDALLNEQVLHVEDWTGDDGGDLELNEPGHPLATTPNALPEEIAHNYQGLGDADRVIARTGILSLYAWSAEQGSSALLAYDPNSAPEGGQILFLPLRYGALDAASRTLLLENAVTWLGTDEWGNCGLAGTVVLEGETDYSGVTLRVQPGGSSTLSMPDGSFALPGLFPGRHTLTASREGFAEGSLQLDLIEGEVISDLVFQLPTTNIQTWCEAPNLEIPDNNFMGVRDTIFVTQEGSVESLELFLDIEHSWIGDLVITLRSPQGITALVHNRTGGTHNEIYGWYPAEMDPVNDFDRFLEHEALGLWSIQVLDQAVADTGVLREWCLRMDLGDGTAAPPSATGRLRLDPAWPNPFNPSTSIRFALGNSSRADLTIYDTAGRRVRRLFSNPLAAGEHQMQWDGRDDSGRSLPSGIYLLRLEADGDRRGQKLVLLQ